MSDVVGVDQYAVQVKAEYILATPPNTTTAEAAAAEVAEKSHENGDNNRDTNSHRDSNTNNNSKKKKNRGQNKKRPRDTYIAYGDKMCQSIVRGVACPFVLTDKGCKYNHNIKEMLATRPLDLHVMDTDGGGGGGAATWFHDDGIGCPNYTLYGYCNYGIMCRLGSFHLNMSTGQNLRREEAKGALEEDDTTETTATAIGGNKTTTFGNNGNVVMNVLSKETQLLLRKNKYPFAIRL